MQGLVYIFVGLAALGVAGIAYFGLTFSIIEAAVTAIAMASVAIVLLERQLRQRSEARIERAIEELARLLSTDAKAGAVLSQRINALTDTNAGSRLEGIEADISVLGTVVRQVAEAVAEMQNVRPASAPRVITPVAPPPPEPEKPEEDTFPEPAIPAALLRQALSENRLLCHIEPVLVMPQRRPYGYDLLPRLVLAGGAFADVPEFMPRRDDADIAQRIEAVALGEAIHHARRMRGNGQSTRLFVPLSRASIGDTASVEQILATLDANRGIAGALNFTISYADWRQLIPAEKSLLAQIGHRGAGFSLAAATTLRFDFGELESIGFNTVRIDATQFLRHPQQFTDFHTSDVASYARRFQIELVTTGVLDEQEVLNLFEEGVALMQGPHITAIGPMRNDLLVEQPMSAATPRRAEL